MSKNDEVELLFPFYALDAVTEEERALVESYVSSNPEAHARLEEELALVSELPLSVQPVSPPPHVKKNVLAYAAAHPKQTAVAPSQTTPHAPKRAARHTPSLWQQLQQSFVFPLLAGSAVALAALLLIWNLNLQRTINTLEGEITTLREEADEQDAILALLPGSSRIPVAGTDADPDGRADLLLAENGVDAVLLVSNLSNLPPDQVYQLWYIGDAGPVDRGTFEVDENGRGRLVVASNTAVQNFSAIGVSIEPRGGSEQPTGDIVLLGEVGAPGSDT